jgi:hypothetical protein
MLVKLTKIRKITRIHFINSKYCVITPKKFVTRDYAVNLCVASFPGNVSFYDGLLNLILIIVNL